MGTRTALTVALLVALGPSPGVGQPKGDAPGRSLGLASVPNLRDVGGYKTRDGRIVKTKLLYRSSQLARVSAADKEKLAALGLTAVYDLRTADERKALPDELPAGATAVPLDVFADSDQEVPAKLRAILQKPAEATAETAATVDALFAKAYREFVTLPGARKAYGELFRRLGEAGAGPAVVHCTSGKDRTGWAAAALLALLGVPEDAIAEDFAKSNDHLLPGYAKAVEAFAKAGGDPAVARAILGVKAEYLRASFDEVKAKYGTIEGYFAKGLGIDEAGQKALRDQFLTKPDE
jgi:protein-tyrosine phosphatase